MYEKLTHNPPTPETVPNPVEQLYRYFSQLPKSPEQTDFIQGQVQIAKISTSGALEDATLYHDSPVYGPDMENGELRFKATTTDGTGELVEYRSIDGSAERFVGPDGQQYRMVFPGFILQAPNPEMTPDATE